MVIRWVSVFEIVLSLAAFDAFAEALESAKFAAAIEAFTQGFEGDGVVVAESVDEDEALSVVHEVAEVQVTDGDVAFENFFEGIFEVSGEFAVEFSGGDQGGQGGGEPAVGSAHGFDDESEAMIGFSETFDFLEILGGVFRVGAGNEVFLDFADVGNELTGATVLFIPFRLWSKPTFHEFLADDFDEKVVMIRMLEDEAIFAFGERFDVLENDHGIN